METFFIWIGALASGLTVVSMLYKSAKWLQAKISRRSDVSGGGVSERPLVVVNWIITVLEKTVVVPFMVEKTEKVIEKVVVPMFAPQRPRPRVPEWVTRPWRQPGENPGEVRPGRPDRASPVREYTDVRPGEDFTRRPGADVDYSTRLGGRGGTPETGPSRPSSGDNTPRSGSQFDTGGHERFVDRAGGRGISNRFDDCSNE